VIQVTTGAEGVLAKGYTFRMYPFASLWEDAFPETMAKVGHRE
jgi:hypothetical protein